MKTRPLRSGRVPFGLTQRRRDRRAASPVPAIIQPFTGFDMETGVGITAAWLEGMTAMRLENDGETIQVYLGEQVMATIAGAPELHELLRRGTRAVGKTRATPTAR